MDNFRPATDDFEKIGSFTNPPAREPAPTECEIKTAVLLGAKGLMSDKVFDMAGENVGRVEEFMVDLADGCIKYAVLSSGGFMGMGDRLFAVPRHALSVDTCDKRLVVNMSKEMLDKAPSFEKDFWPDMGKEDFQVEMLGYYGSGSSGHDPLH
jgi:sporulation protein YlmC with PRC-barrel domain